MLPPAVYLRRSHLAHSSQAAGVTPDLAAAAPPGEVRALIERGLRDAGLAPERIFCHPDEEGAALALMAWANAGDVVVLPVHTRAVRQRLAAVIA